MLFKVKNFIYCALLIVFFVDGSISGILPTSSVNTKQCREDGVYCQNSSDCCSNHCIALSWKCAKRPPLSGYMPPTSTPVDSSVDDLVKEVDYEHFDESKMVAIMVIVRAKLYPSSGGINNSSQCVDIGGNCNDSSQCCSNACLDYLNADMCITGLPESSGGLCRIDGTWCFGHDECCSKRCDGSSRKCV